jgi:hypothetical protein
VLITVACLVVSQVGYFVGVLLEYRAGIANFLADDVFDDEPNNNREQDIAGEHEEERREHPSRSPPPET